MGECKQQVKERWGERCSIISLQNIRNDRGSELRIYIHRHQLKHFFSETVSSDPVPENKSSTLGFLSLAPCFGAVGASTGVVFGFRGLFQPHRGIGPGSVNRRVSLPINSQTPGSPPGSWKLTAVLVKQSTPDFQVQAFGCRMEYFLDLFCVPGRHHAHGGALGRQQFVGGLRPQGPWWFNP